MEHDNLKPNSIIEQIWSNLNDGVQDRDHDYHTAVFSSLDNNHQPTSRTIILRSCIKEDKILTFHSDFRSPKTIDIKKNNECFLLFYSSKLKEQLRIKVLSSLQYKNHITKEAWEKTQLMSRKCYLTSFPPGHLINYPTDGIPDHLIGKEPEKIESEKGYINFCVITPIAPLEISQAIFIFLLIDIF